MDSDLAAEDICADEVKAFFKSLNLPADRQPRDYQIKAFIKAIRNRRLLLLSPTASGKSLIIYMICCWYKLKTLVIVPTTQLVEQMANDFESYGYEEEIHKIKSGVEHETDCLFTISTWQSMQREDPEFLQQFDVVIVDEAHSAQAKALSEILEKMKTTRYRFGTTGTINDTKTHEFVLQGHFGKIEKVTTTAELMKQGHIANLKIKCIVLKYPEHVCKEVSKLKYQDEINFLCQSDFRNKFIKRLADSLEGNTLVLYQYVEKHGKPLNDMMQNVKKPLHFIHGGIDGEDREEIRQIVNSSKESIILASKGTTSTGTNMPSINDAIFAAPSKSKIQNLQSIGRQLRKSEIKHSTTLFDIADDLQYKSTKNHTLKHFLERCKIYDSEQFDYQIYEVEVK